MPQMLDTFYNASSDDGFDISQEPGIDLSGMDPEKREQLQQEWRQELAKVFISFLSFFH